MVNDPQKCTSPFHVLLGPPRLLFGGAEQKAELHPHQPQCINAPLSIRDPRESLVTKDEDSKGVHVDVVCVLHTWLNCALCYSGTIELGRPHLKYTP